MLVLTNYRFYIVSDGNEFEVKLDHGLKQNDASSKGGDQPNLNTSVILHTPRVSLSLPNYTFLQTCSRVMTSVGTKGRERESKDLYVFLGQRPGRRHFSDS